MLKTPPSQQPCLNKFRLTNALTPLAIGVALVASAGISVEARPVIVIQSPIPTTRIVGSPIRRSAPVVSGTTSSYSFSSYSYGNYNTGSPYSYGSYSTVSPSYYGSYTTVSPSYYQGYPVITPGRSVIQNTTLINPTLINPRVSDSVLVNPVIINSPRYPVAPIGGSRFIYTSPGVRIRVGQ